ncbi:adenylate/guanylate cyclase domain-containing protein [Cellvibrio sp.]
MVAEHNQHCEQTLMFTDIVGYSRLMGRNETMAIEMLGDYRKILLSHIEQQNGQLVEFIGDAIFARFDSAASATAAAIAIQQHLQAFNEVRDKKLPPLQTRIGLHKGEVMLRDGAVFGDSVNIAARLEPLAVADGICISQTVYDEIRFTLSSPAKRLGVQALKNIEQKIRVYLIKPTGIGWRDHLFYFLRGLNKKIHAYRYPLTACLFALIVAGFYFIPRWLVPGYTANYVEIADFQNLMNEKGDADYFSAGITEAVRSQLADMRDVYIVDAKEGIHAPIRLEGSVQRLGDNLRIAYRLFRRKDNVQIAGGKLDGTYQDIFILQDRLVGEIARYLADEFELQNFRPAPLRLTSDVTAYDYYLKGIKLLDMEMTQKNVDESIQFFSESIVHDVNFSLAYSGLCQAYLKKYYLTYSDSWLDESSKNCFQSLEKDKFSPKAHSAIGLIYKARKEYKTAIEWLTKAKSLDEDDPSIMIHIASVYGSLGDSKRAEEIYKIAINKYSKSWLTYSSYGFFLMQQKRYQDSIRLYKKSLEILPENSVVFNNIAANYMYLDDFNAAAVALESASKIEPSSFVFGNSGSLYYLSSRFNESLKMYKMALELEPDNFEWQINIADLYKYGLRDEVLANRHYKMALNSLMGSADERNISPKNYQFMARAYLGVDDLKNAEIAINAADRVDVSSVEANYAHLKISIEKRDFESVKFYVKQLLDSGYSYNLIKSDPGLSYLRDNKFLKLSEIEKGQ